METLATYVIVLLLLFGAVFRHTEDPERHPEMHAPASVGGLNVSIPAAITASATVVMPSFPDWSKLAARSTCDGESIVIDLNDPPCA